MSLKQDEARENERARKRACELPLPTIALPTNKISLVYLSTQINKNREIDMFYMVTLIARIFLSLHLLRR